MAHLCFLSNSTLQPSPFGLRVCGLGLRVSQRRGLWGPWGYVGTVRGSLIVLGGPCWGSFLSMSRNFHVTVGLPSGIIMNVGRHAGLGVAGSEMRA